MKTTTLLALALGFSAAARAEEAKKGMNDPQIATVALTAHQIDIDRGTRALKRSKNAEIKQFAEQMVSDHTAGRNEALALAKKLGVTPEESEVTRSLKGDANRTEQRLAREKGATFDKDYIDTEVAYQARRGNSSRDEHVREVF